MVPSSGSPSGRPGSQRTGLTRTPARPDTSTASFSFKSISSISFATDVILGLWVLVWEDMLTLPTPRVYIASGNIPAVTIHSAKSAWSRWDIGDLSDPATLIASFEPGGSLPRYWTNSQGWFWEQATLVWRGSQGTKTEVLAAAGGSGPQANECSWKKEIRLQKLVSGSQTQPPFPIRICAAVHCFARGCPTWLDH